jgi:hypothetical protein
MNIYSADEPWDGDFKWSHENQWWTFYGDGRAEDPPDWVPHDAAGYPPEVERR